MTAALAGTRLSRIEDAGINASAPPQQVWVDGWLVRFSPGKAKRARCINALAPGRLTLTDRLAHAEALLHPARLPLIVRITPFTMPPDLDDALAALGLQRFDDSVVMVGDLAALALADPLPAGWRLDAADAAEFADQVGALRGSPAAHRRAHAERLARSPVPYRGWLLRCGGAVAACGQFAREADLVGLYDVFTAPAARNRGAARLLCAELLRRAGDEGARTAYLQVDRANLPARAVYRRLGFVDGYGYHYRAADPAAA